MTYEEAMRYAEHWILSADRATMNANREADATLAQAYIAYARELREVQDQKDYMKYMEN